MSIKAWCLAVLAAGCLLAPTAQAKRSHSQPAPTVAAALGESQLVEHGHYVNRDGQTVHAPAHTLSGAPPAGASAQCLDGSYSFSASRRGTCSRHGGVASGL